MSSRATMGCQVPEGGPFLSDPGRRHADAKTSGGKSLKIIVIYIFDKTKPLATPAP